MADRARVEVRTFFCSSPAWPQRIFAERLDGGAHAIARRTDRQGNALTAIVSSAC